MSRACDAVGGINLGQGICDLPAPLPVADAAREAITQNRVVYTAPEGSCRCAGDPGQDQAALRARFRSDERDRGDLGGDGRLRGGVPFAVRSGDEIILFEPYYGYHLNTVISLGLSPVLVPTRPPEWGSTSKRWRARSRHGRAPSWCARRRTRAGRCGPRTSWTGWRR